MATGKWQNGFLLEQSHASKHTLTFPKPDVTCSDFLIFLSPLKYPDCHNKIHMGYKRIV